MTGFVAIVIGCLECSLQSEVMGVYPTQAEAEAALTAKANEPLRFSANPHAPYSDPITLVSGNWDSDHCYEVHAIPAGSEAEQ